MASDKAQWKDSTSMARLPVFSLRFRKLNKKTMRRKQCINQNFVLFRLKKLPITCFRVTMSLLNAKSGRWKSSDACKMREEYRRKHNHCRNFRAGSSWRKSRSFFFELQLPPGCVGASHLSGSWKVCTTAFKSDKLHPWWRSLE